MDLRQISGSIKCERSLDGLLQLRFEHKNHLEQHFGHAKEKK
jgi:hypothetical protein